MIIPMEIQLTLDVVAILAVSCDRPLVQVLVNIGLHQLTPRVNEGGSTITWGIPVERRGLVLASFSYLFDTVVRTRVLEVG